MLRELKYQDPTILLYTQSAHLKRLKSLSSKKRNCQPSDSTSFLIQRSCKTRRSHRRLTEQLALYRWFMKGQLHSTPDHSTSIHSVIPALHQEFRTASVLATLEDDWFRTSAAAIILPDETDEMEASENVYATQSAQAIDPIDSQTQAMALTMELPVELCTLSLAEVNKRDLKTFVLNDALSSKATSISQ